MSANIDSVVLLTSTNSENDQFGTGFVIYKDLTASYILTCAHVVDRIKEPVMAENSVVTTLAYSGKELGIDLAVLRIAEPFHKPPLPLGPSGAQGQSIIIPGFQLDETGDFEFRKLHGTLGDPLELRIRRKLVQIKAWDIVITDDYSLQRGYSGSPVIVKESGQVIGVVDARRGTKKGRAIAVEMLSQIWDIQPKPPAVSTSPAISVAIKGHTEEINAIMQSDGSHPKIAPGGSSDKTDDVWNLHTVQPLYFQRVNHREITAVAISSDRKILSSSDTAGTITLWDLDTRKGAQTLVGDKRKVLCIAISPEKEIIAGGLEYYLDAGVIDLWDLKTGRLFSTLTEHEDDVIAITFRIDDGTLISGSTDKTIRQWDLERQQSVGEPLRLSKEIKSLTISADGKFAGSIENKTIHLWDLVTQQHYPIVNIVTAKAKLLAIKTNGDALAIGNDDGTISLWMREPKIEKVATSNKRERWQPLIILTGKASRISCIAFSSDSRTIVSGKRDGTIEFWDIGNFLSSLIP